MPQRQQFNPVVAFPEFYANPVIAELATNPRWTVSSTKTTEARKAKFPLDMRAFLYGGLSKAGDPVSPGIIRGAWSPDEECLVTLDEMTSLFPLANNCAYYLQVDLDRYMVLDIEKDCPPAEAARLLSMAGALYTEVSMSTLGYHLVMPMPKNFSQWPDATGKRVLKHPKGWWEILLEHWITFTRLPIPPDRFTELSQGHSIVVPTWEEVWAELASEAVASPSIALDIEDECPDLPYRNEIVNAVVGTGHGKSPADFHHDTSRFEFSVLGVYDHRLELLLQTVTFPGDIDGSQFDDNDRTWLLYLAATKGLPYRDKHSELRSGLPYLLSQAAALRGRRVAQQEMTLTGRSER